MPKENKGDKVEKVPYEFKIAQQGQKVTGDYGPQIKASQRANERAPIYKKQNTMTGRVEHFRSKQFAVEPPEFEVNKAGEVLFPPEVMGKEILRVSFFFLY